jgi:hypothetical protein
VADKKSYLCLLETEVQSQSFTALESDARFIKILLYLETKYLKKNQNFFLSSSLCNQAHIAGMREENPPPPFQTRREKANENS